MIAYLDIVGGVSGDMILGAVVDAGITVERLQEELSLLPVSGWRLAAERVRRGASSAALVTVKLDEESPRNLDWDIMRNFTSNSNLPEPDKVAIFSVFKVLEEAETAAHSHDVSPSRHTELHELGTLDTLIDVAGAVVGMRLLCIDALYASPLPMAHGWAVSSHGRMASASPATRAICLRHKLPLCSSIHAPYGESITPTGAAIVAALARFNQTVFVPSVIGNGAGSRDTQDGPPNIVSLWLGEGNPPQYKSNHSLVLLETNIDDATGEVVAHAVGRLLRECALDAWIVPVIMKKGRPGLVLSALVEKQKEAEALGVIMRETTTFGVRRRDLERYEAVRSMHDIPTKFGLVPTKFKYLSGGEVQPSPEYEACRTIAEANHIPLMEVMNAAAESARTFLETRESMDT